MALSLTRQTEMGRTCIKKTRTASFPYNVQLRNGHVDDAVAGGGLLELVKHFIIQGAEVNGGNDEGWTALHIAAQMGHLDVTKHLISQGAEVIKGDNKGWTALHSAAQGGHLEVTKYLISQGAEVNKRDNEGWNALHIASQKGHLDVTEYLFTQGAKVNKGDNEGAKGYQSNIKHWVPLYAVAGGGLLELVKNFIIQGAEVNGGNDEGWTALHIAAKMGHLDVTKHLISQGAEVNRGDNKGRNALHIASQEGHLDVTEYLISQGAEVNKGDNEGRTALHFSAYEGHLDVIKYLIRQGAEVNKGDNEGVTVLHFAAHEGHLDVTKYLISKGAEVKEGDNKSRTALIFAAFHGHLDVTKYLLISQETQVNRGGNEGRTLLHLASVNGHIDVIKYLISQGAEVNKGDDVGRTALHIASQNGHLDVTKYLIRRRAEMNKRDNEGRTALHSASESGHLDVTKYLINQGAKVNEGDNEGLTALQFAAVKGHLDVINYLISQGAEVNLGNNAVGTALRYAAFYGHLEVTKCLISQGAEVNKGGTHGWTALHSAAHEGHFDIIKYLIIRGAEVNKEDNEGRFALKFAASQGHIDVTKYLISQGAEVNKRDNDGKTALHSAAKEGHLDVTKYLISQGAKVNERDNEGRTALHSAAFDGQLGVTTYLFNKGAEVNERDNAGMTALHIAAYFGHLYITTFLIRQGAEVNGGNKDGRTALHIASQNSYLDVTKYLISQGAEVNKGDNEGRTALHVSAFRNHLEITNYLISRGAQVNKGDNRGNTPLQFASFYGNLEITKYLISEGAEVNKRDIEGRTALHSASEEGHLDVTKYLISQGAKLNEGDNEGRTALQLAASKDRLDVTKYLISEGAEVNKGDNEGWTALHSASEEGHLDVTKNLISQGAKVNEGNNEGRTALQLAAFKDRLDVTKYLISEGAEVNKGDNGGRTALHTAAQEGHLDVTKYLIIQGAEVNRGDNEGRTALHSAAQEGHLEFTKYLISQGAEVNRGDNEGRTVLHSAAQEGHLGVTKYFLAQGISVNMVDRNGFTPLHNAAMKGDFDIVKVLLEEGALVDVKNANGQNPLHLSSKKGSTDSSDSLAKRAKITGILDHRDDDGLTAIHLATQNGHTPVVASLVSHGASLNIKSHDGKTCLHEAIILSDHEGRKEQTKGRSKQISEDFYHHELSPEKALVLYLLEHGAKLDIRDGEGKLPVQYATNEVIRHMIFSKLPSIEMITRFRAEEAIPFVTVSAHVNNRGKQIELEDRGISMSIPLGAVQESGSCEITLTTLKDPPNINSQGNESVACYGIRCDPPDMIFHQPVKIRIPHSAFIVNPDQVKPDIVCLVWDSTKNLPRTLRMQSSSSPEEPPYCRVYKRHLELYIGYCAEWWVLIPLEQHVIRHQLLCTPYIPDRIERGKEFLVHLQMHADLSGIERDIQEEKKQQSYHKSHRSVPFSVESKSGDVTVTCHREGEHVESKELSLTDVYSKMRHNLLLSVAPSEDDVEFTGITITITQAGKLGVSRSIAFVIRHTDGPEYQFPSEPQSFLRALEEVSKSDLADIDVLTIAQAMTVDQFYDLGVALGFTITQLDVIEYRRFRDREQAVYDMLVTWRERQPSGQAVKETFLSLMESLDSPAEEMAVSDIGLTGDIPDRTLLAFARQIRPNKFFEMGRKLGFNTSELQHIEHGTLYNRKDANIQMLSRWIASQTSGTKAKQTLKLVWDSVQDASKAEKTKDSGKGIALLNTETAGTSQALADESDQGTTGAEESDHDNLPERAQSDGTNDVEQVNHALDGSSATGTFGALGGKLSTKSHGFTLHIPPGALEEDEEISLRVLAEIPNGLTLKEDELLVSHGFQCYPSGLRFKKPAKLIIPHCALVTAPNKVQTILYSWNQSGTPKRLPDSSDFICSVQERWLEVSISHFSGGILAVLWDWVFLKGILLSCMPFLPRLMPLSRKPILEVRFAKKPHDQKWDDVHALKDPCFQPVKGDDDDIVFLRGTLTVACQLGEKSPKSEAIQFSDIRTQTKVTKYFELDLTKESDETLVTLEVIQTSTQTIKFNTRFQAKTNVETTPAAGAAFGPMDARSQSEDVSTLSGEVTDEKITRLSKILPDGKYSELLESLGFNYDYIQKILKKNVMDSTAAFKELLQEWKNKGGSMKDLDAALEKKDLGGLVPKYKN